MIFRHEEIVLRDTSGGLVTVIVGDELVELGFPASHKRVYVGPIGPFGANIVDPAKIGPAQFVHHTSIPNWQNLHVGARGPVALVAQRQVQARARQVISAGMPNLLLTQNCDHITSYIRDGKADSPQLAFWTVVGAGALLLGLFGARQS